MWIDLTEIIPKRKSNKFKLFILIVIICLVIFLIYTKYIKNTEKNVEEPVDVSNEIIIEEIITGNGSEETQTIKLPNITESGINNIQNIYNSQEKNVYLTFDDGPSKTVTPMLLDKLKENNIKATFFVLGNRVNTYPEIVKRAYDEGHYIANHGFSHVYSNLYANPENVLNEYIQTESVIKSALQISEYNSGVFRFPGGSVGSKYSKIKTEAINLLRQNNITYIDWNCLTNDSAGNTTKKQLFESYINTSQNKSSLVILMHDSADKILTYEILQDIINSLIERGYNFKNLYDIIY